MWERKKSHSEYYPYDQSIIKAWKERFKRYGVFKDLTHLSDKDLEARLRKYKYKLTNNIDFHFDYLLKYNGPMLGSESCWGLLLELIERQHMKPETIEEEEVIKTPFVPKVIQGGKGPTDLGPDWLSSLEINTTFLIQGKKDTNFTLGQATVIYKGAKGVLLLIASQSKEPVWVDPVRFCNNYRWYETIQTAEEAQTEMELNKEIGERCMADGHSPSEPSNLA